MRKCLMLLFLLEIASVTVLSLCFFPSPLYPYMARLHIIAYKSSVDLVIYTYLHSQPKKSKRKIKQMVTQIIASTEFVKK